MIPSFTIVSLLAAVAIAQKPSPLIPSGISSTCTSFLTTFNSGNTLQTCTKALIDATKSFSPTSNTTASSADVSTAVGALCNGANAADATCSKSTIGSLLSQFWAGCQAELTTAKNDEVADMYEALYTLKPLLDAMCTVDDNNQPCLLQISKYAKNVPKPNGIVSTDNDGAITPNMAAIGSSNLLFFLLDPSVSSDLLCTSCTRKVMAAFTDFETDYQFAPGMNNAVALAGQSPLYNNVVSTCGANFFGNGAVQAAGSLSGGLGSGSSSDSAAITTVADMKTVVSVALGVVVALASFNL